MGSLIDRTGRRYGKLVVVRRADSPGENQKVKWECICDCGNSSVVSSSCLATGHSKSCGCNRPRGDRVRTWNGGKTVSRNKILVLLPHHPHADKRGYVPEHILIAESVLGRRLPPNAVVHHINGNPHDNNKSNLVICEDRKYHNFIHARSRALKECGDARYMKCPYCKQYDDPGKLYIDPNGHTHGHRECINIHLRKKHGWKKRCLK